MFGKIEMKFIKFASLFFVTLTLIAGIAIPVVPDTQSWFQFPSIPGLEEKARNIFFHVPIAWTSFLAFLVSLFYGYRFLRTREMENDIKSVSAAGLGTLFCVLATITGSIWAKFNWGAFWNWDPRETSIFILLLVYGAYFALRSALNSDEVRARLSAVYSILAGLTAPFFIFVLPRLVTGLHPGAKSDANGASPVIQLQMEPNMVIVFFAGLIGFSLLFFWLFMLRVKIENLEQKISSHNL